MPLGLGLKRLMSSAEDDMTPSSISMSLDGAGGSSCFAAGMHTYITEVATEAGFEEGACGGVERVSWRTQDIADRVRDVSWCARRGCPSMDSRLIFLAFLALLAASAAGTRGCGWKASSMRTHDPVGDMVCFAFFGIVWMADCELGLDYPVAEHLLHGIVAGLLLELEHGMQRLRGQDRARDVRWATAFGLG